MMLTLSSFFSTKLVVHGLVMDDHYGQVDLRLIPINNNNNILNIIIIIIYAINIFN